MPMAAGLPPSCSQRPEFDVVAAARFRRGLRFDQRGQRLVERVRSLRQNDPILRAFRSSKARLDRSEIERKQFRIFRFRCFVVVEKSLLAAISLDQSNLLGAASAKFQIFQTLFIDGEDAAGSAVFRRHVGNRSAIGKRQITQAGPEVLNKFPHDSMLAQHFSDRQNQIGSRSAFAQTAISFTPTTSGINIETGCPSIAASASMPSHTPSEHPNRYHRVVTVGAQPTCRDGDMFAIGSWTKTTRAKYSRLTWWTMPVSGGTMARLRNPVWPQRRKE